MTYIIKYFYGLANGACLVFADSPENARAVFLKHHPTLRDYNIRGVAPTNKRVFALR